MSASYEEPTNEFRQVKTPIKRGNGVRGPGYAESVVGYDITIQRKWIVHSKGVRDSCAAQWSRGKYEWRDLPTVDSKEAL